MIMDNRTYKSPLKFNIGGYEIDLVTFDLKRITYTFKELDNENKLRLLNKWLGDSKWQK